MRLKDLRKSILLMTQDEALAVHTAIREVREKQVRGVKATKKESRTLESRIVALLRKNPDLIKLLNGGEGEQGSR